MTSSSDDWASAELEMRKQQIRFQAALRIFGVDTLVKAAAEPEIEKVGPHGYVHGWIKVAASDLSDSFRDKDSSSAWVSGGSDAVDSLKRGDLDNAKYSLQRAKKAADNQKALASGSGSPYLDENERARVHAQASLESQQIQKHLDSISSYMKANPSYREKLLPPLARS
jgi:hypothetical protein